MFNSEMSFIANAIAVAGTFAASCFDVKTREIPNWLTMPMIGAGLAISAIRIFYGSPWILIVFPLAISFLLIWFMWRGGLFGGGDAKLLMGIVSLIPLFPDENSFIPTFFLMLALSTFMQFFISGVYETAKEKKRKEIFFASLPVGIACVSYLLTRSLLISVFCLAFSADAVASLLPYRKKVKVSDKIRGEMLAERIGKRNGEVVRIAEKPSLLLKIFPGNDDFDEIIAAPSHLGITDEEIEKLREFCDYVYIFRSHPMAPAILLALLLSLTCGDLFGI